MHNSADPAQVSGIYKTNSYKSQYIYMYIVLCIAFFSLPRNLCETANYGLVDDVIQN